MAQWCWIGVGLFCLGIGAAVALLALFIWFIGWLIKSGRRAPPAPTALTPMNEYTPPSPSAKEETTERPLPEEPEQVAPTAPMAPAAVDGPFITYESRNAGQITLHRRGCWVIEKKSGGHRHGAGLYVGHPSFEAAKLYADGTDLNVRECGICKPGNTA